MACRPDCIHLYPGLLDSPLKSVQRLQRPVNWQAGAFVCIETKADSKKGSQQPAEIWSRMVFSFLHDFMSHVLSLMYSCHTLHFPLICNNRSGHRQNHGKSMFCMRHVFEECRTSFAILSWLSLILLHLTLTLAIHSTKIAVWTWRPSGSASTMAIQLLGTTCQCDNSDWGINWHPTLRIAGVAGTAGFGRKLLWPQHIAKRQRVGSSPDLPVFQGWKTTKTSLSRLAMRRSWWLNGQSKNLKNL